MGDTTIKLPANVAKAISEMAEHAKQHQIDVPPLVEALTPPQYMPISTVPEDGTEVLLKYPSGAIQIGSTICADAKMSLAPAGRELPRINGVLPCAWRPVPKNI